MQPQKTKPPRPLGVTALGILILIIGLFGIAGGATMLVDAKIILAGLDALLAVAIGVFYVVAGIGFFREKVGHGCWG
jgi:ammonia channel protein AmtB